jgi:nucleotide-binding universal stress UspA family protein
VQHIITLKKLNNRPLLSVIEGSKLIEKILVAIDGSDHSDHALDFALDLAQRYSAKILLLTVVPPVFLPIASLNVIKSQAVADASAELEKSFSKALSNAEGKAKKRLAKLSVFAKLEHGNPDEVIIETAKLGNFDMVVIGSRGLGRRDYALGSVSSKVADNATCPVLIVK